MVRLLPLILAGALLLSVGACDPVTGSGSGTPPDPGIYLTADASTETAILILIAGYPATDYQFNYDGYGSGSLVITIPAGWQVTVQCENRGTVPNSCAVVSGKNDVRPLEPAWSTPDPLRGLDPGQSASFVFTPAKTGSYRIASLVGGHEASGMWADLEVTSAGHPTIAAG
jgi:Sulfocyanin (SoxE) domain